MKILFFIGTLSAGGKERRLIELLSYLKTHTNYKLLVVLRRDLIDYPAFYELNIPCIKLTKNYTKGDILLHYRFYKICRDEKPDIVHTWGSMPAFVSLLAILILKIIHINSQITDAPPNIKIWSFKNLINRINFRFSTIILANSNAGLKAYNIKTRNCKVIYNGINLNRFENLAEKNIIMAKYGIMTPFILIMVASFSDNKDYDLFVDVAKIVSKRRNDITFMAVGDGINLERIKKRVVDEHIPNVSFTGKINNVESHVNVADIGLLFSNKIVHGEGISNSVLEYMALGKLVIANDAGGTNEIIKQGINGYLISSETTEEIVDLLTNLLHNKVKLLELGKNGINLIQSSFTVDKMGMEFQILYEKALTTFGNRTK